MNKNRSRILIIGCMVIISAVSMAQSNLTGVVWYTTNSAKQFNGGYANTYGGDTYSRNLYVSLNQQVGSGPLLNSGNATVLPTRVDVSLATAGVYRFQMYCNDESSLENPYWGLNLFFDGDDHRPGIAAWNVVNLAGFQSVNSIDTPTLDPRTMGLVQDSSPSGSGLEFSGAGGGTMIRLTDYRTWSTTRYHVDRVDNWSDLGGAGNGTKDQVIEFTLEVSPVPEPATIAVMGGALATLLRRRFRPARS